MQKVEVIAQLKSGDHSGREAKVAFNLPETTEEAVETYDEAIVFSRFRSAIVIDLQSFMRSQLNKEKQPTAEEIQEAVDNWKPGVRAQGKSASEKADAILSKLSAEERKELFGKYMEDEKPAAGGRGGRR